MDGSVVVGVHDVDGRSVLDEHLDHVEVPGPAGEVQRRRAVVVVTRHLRPANNCFQCGLCEAIWLPFMTCVARVYQHIKEFVRAQQWENTHSNHWQSRCSWLIPRAQGKDNLEFVCSLERFHWKPSRI